MSGFKTVLGASLVVGSLGYYVDSLVSTEATYAVIAARRYALTSPANGYLDVKARAATVHKAGEELATVKRSSRVDPEVRRMETELAVEEAEVSVLGELISAGRGLVSTATSRVASMSAKRMRQLNQTSDETQSELKVSGAEVETAVQKLERAKGLCEEGLMTAQDCDRARADVTISERQLEVARDKARLAALNLDAAGQGADVDQSGTSQIVFYKQHESDMVLRVADLQKERSVRQARVNALRSALADDEFKIIAPARTVVWNYLRGPQSIVDKGEPLMDVANCDDLFVYAQLPVAKYASLGIGTPVHLKIGKRELPGKVLRLLGPTDSVTNSANMLPMPPMRNSTGKSAEMGAVQIESPALEDAVGRDCAIGTVVEARFDPK